MLEKVWIMIKEGTGNAAENAERLKMRLNAQGLEAKTPEAIGQTGPRGCEESNGPCGCAESVGSCGCAESAGPCGHTGSAGQLYLTDCPEAARRFAGGDCCILLYLTEESRKLPMEAYPYAVQDLDGIDADYLEGVYRRWAKKPWEILRTPRLIVREQTEEDLDSLYEIYAHPDMTAYTEGLSSDREEERERLRSYIAAVYPLYGFGIWMLEKRRTPEAADKTAAVNKTAAADKTAAVNKTAAADKTAAENTADPGTGTAPAGHTESGSCIGRAGFFWREDAQFPELGFAVKKSEQGKGYCLEACRAILRFGFEELGFSCVQALTREGNRAAEAVLARLGFRRDGCVRADGVPAARWLLRRAARAEETGAQKGETAVWAEKAAGRAEGMAAQAEEAATGSPRGSFPQT